MSDEKEGTKDAAASAHPPRSLFREYAEAFIIAAIFLRFANVFVLQTFYIPSGSMEKTLLIGDHLFVNRFIYGSEPSALEKLMPGRAVQRGDIVVFRSPENPTLDLVKRCIGVPGDRIEVSEKQLYINGQRVEDSTYAQHVDMNTYPDRDFFRPDLRKRDNFGPYEVPKGHYFCMGDNRDHSYDSRFWGPVPAHMVKGRALIIYWSYGGETSDGHWPGWGEKFKQVGGTIAGFFGRTRWERTFRVVH